MTDELETPRDMPKMTALEEHLYDVVADLRAHLKRIEKSARLLKLEDVLAHSAEASETINDLRAFNIAAQLRIEKSALEAENARLHWRVKLLDDEIELPGGHKDLRRLLEQKVWALEARLKEAEKLLGTVMDETWLGDSNLGKVISKFLASGGPTT